MTCDPTFASGVSEHVVRIGDVVDHRAHVGPDLAGDGQKRGRNGTRGGEPGHGAPGLETTRAARDAECEQRHRNAHYHECEPEVEEHSHANENAGQSEVATHPQPPDQREDAEDRQARVAGVVPVAGENQRVQDKGDRRQQARAAERAHKQRGKRRSDREPEDVEQKGPAPAEGRERAGVCVVEERPLVVEHVDIKPVAAKQAARDAEKDAGIGRSGGRSAQQHETGCIGRRSAAEPPSPPAQGEPAN